MSTKNNRRKNNIITAEQVSEYLNIPLRTIYHLSKTGKIKGVKIGKQWRYNKDNIEKYLQYGTDFSNEPPRIPDKFTRLLREGAGFIERRTYPRINCSLPCFIKVYIPDEKKVFSTGNISNISQGGVFIKNHKNDNLFKHIKNDDPINLRFEIKENSRLKVDGRVLRVQYKGIAVKFKKLHPEGRQQR